jgi:hypothetical protein
MLWYRCLAYEEPRRVSPGFWASSPQALVISQAFGLVARAARSRFEPCYEFVEEPTYWTVRGGSQRKAFRETRVLILPCTFQAIDLCHRQTKNCIDVFFAYHSSVTVHATLREEHRDARCGGIAASRNVVPWLVIDQCQEPFFVFTQWLSHSFGEIVAIVDFL